jgi:type I restriction enzyme S subunit
MFYILFSISPFIKARENNVSRTTVGHLSDKDLKSIKILVPKANNKFKPRETLDSLLEKILEARRENEELIALRDWLLPLLMNGQVRVKGAGVYEMKEEELGMVAEEYI